ncbi:MAG: formimidoylglutamase [Calditrichia bacterium]
MYRPPLAFMWNGRKGLAENTCLFQRIELLDLDEDAFPVLDAGQKGIAFLGFASDEGVRRNQGRVGAANGPEALRKALSGMSGRINENVVFVDCGDIACSDSDLQAAQEELGAMVARILAANFHPILLGGGHSIAYGHYLGIEKQTENKKLGIINIDAHFDLRPYKYEPNSGTPFLQIADRRKAANKKFSYMCIGIQEHANSRDLFETAARLRVDTVLGDDVNRENLSDLKHQLEDFLADYEAIYLTICLDVFAAPFAPGVSAPAHIGIEPAVAALIIDCIANSGKSVSFDVAEMNPEYDIDNRTARMAAALIYRMIRGIV